MTAMIVEALSGWLAWALAGLAALAAVYIAGKRNANQKAVQRELRATVKTHERINDADIAVDAPHAVDWLRARDADTR